MRAELGVSESGLARLIRAAFELLELIVFFTADEDKEAMARACAAARPPGRPPGEIHTEIQEAFVRAEVVGWDDLVEAGGYAAARDRGLLRTEGRELRGGRRRRDHDQGLDRPVTPTRARLGAADRGLWAAIDDYEPADFSRRGRAAGGRTVRPRPRSAVRARVRRGRLNRPLPEAEPLDRQASPAGYQHPGGAGRDPAREARLRNLGLEESVGLLEAERKAGSDELRRRRGRVPRGWRSPTSAASARLPA